MKANEKVAARVVGFVAKIQDETNKYYAENFKNLTPSIIEISNGGKFFKVIKSDQGSRSVYCFIDKQTGDIYKAAGWAAPAKHVRGNIFDANFGWGTAVNLYGANYLR